MVHNCMCFCFAPSCWLQLAQRRNIDPLAPVDHSLTAFLCVPVACLHLLICYNRCLQCVFCTIYQCQHVCVAAFVFLQLAQRRNIDPLAPVDHSLIEYDDFAKDFYTEHPSITAMTDQQVRPCVSGRQCVIAWDGVTV